MMNKFSLTVMCLFYCTKHNIVDTKVIKNNKVNTNIKISVSKTQIIDSICYFFIKLILRQVFILQQSAGYLVFYFSDWLRLLYPSLRALAKQQQVRHCEPVRVKQSSINKSVWIG
ncbi:MAG: hypothetical protein LBH30_05465 [Prevotellaceae bacterium]|jgi:uncharacterized protein YpbB|nr:hypothetical protein [Prevotellaceae bacterium]